MRITRIQFIANRILRVFGPNKRDGKSRKRLSEKSDARVVTSIVCVYIYVYTEMYFIFMLNIMYSLFRHYVIFGII